VQRILRGLVEKDRVRLRTHHVNWSSEIVNSQCEGTIFAHDVFLETNAVVYWARAVALQVEGASLIGSEKLKAPIVRKIVTAE